MKRFLLLCVALVALVFVGCNKENGPKVDGTNINGMWVLVAEEYDGDYDSFYDEVDTILVIEGDTATEYYHPDDYFSFRDGYIYGTTFEEFETDYDLSYGITGDYLTMYGIPFCKIDVKNGRLVLTITFDDEGGIVYWERVKGFK